MASAAPNAPTRKSPLPPNWGGPRAPARSGAAPAPDRVDARDVRGGLRAELALLHRPPEIHRALAAQRCETAVHLGRDRARMGARFRLLGPQLRAGKFLREIFEDRQRFPDMDFPVGERRHFPGRTDFHDPALELRI